MINLIAHLAHSKSNNKIFYQINQCKNKLKINHLFSLHPLLNKANKLKKNRNSLILEYSLNNHKITLFLIHLRIKMIFYKKLTLQTNRLISFLIIKFNKAILIIVNLKISKISSLLPIKPHKIKIPN